MSEICFIEARPRVAATGVETVVRLAGGGTDTEYYRGGQHYRAGIVSMPRFRAAFGFDDDGWTGGTVPTNGELGFLPGVSGLVDELAAYYWRDAAIVIDAGDERAALVRRLTGTVASVATAEGKLAFTITDPGKLLDKPIVGTGFTGAGGVEGPVEAAGRVKRRSWGQLFNVPGGLLDKANNIFEFGDPSKPLQAFDAVRDMGRAGPIVLLAWQGSVAATFAALQAAAAPQGGGVVAPSIACVKWWTQPAGPLTADIRGEVAGGYASSAVAIAARMLAAVDGPVIADQAAADALRPATCGVHIATSSDTVAQAIDRLFLGCSLYWVLQPDGTIRVGEWAWKAPVAAFEAIFIGRERQLPPVKSRKLGYRRNHQIHQASEISVAATGNLLVQPTPPAADVSFPGQLWQDDGARYWRRRPDVHLSVGGKRLMVAGKLLTIVWTPNGSQPVRTIGEAAEEAQATATNAMGRANLANEILANIASDDKLTAGEKPAAIAQRDRIVADQPGIDAQAVAYGITTEKAAYDAKVAALVAYLATLTTPTLWSNLSGDTDIVGATFRAAFGDVFSSQQALLNKIAEKAGTTATWGGIPGGSGKPEDNADVTANAQVTVVPPSTITLYRDWQGNVKAGQLPIVVRGSVKRGGIDITQADTTDYTVVGTAALAGKVAIETRDGNAAKGDTTIDGISGAGTFLTTVSVNGIEIGTYTTQLVTKDDNPPVDNGSGGGTDSSLGAVASTSYVFMTGLDADDPVMSVTLTATGGIKLSVNHSYYCSLTAGRRLTCKAVYSTDNWATMHDLDSGTTEVTGSVAYRDADWSVGLVPGSIVASYTKMGLPAGTYLIALLGKNSGSGSLTPADGRATTSKA